MQRKKIHAVGGLWDPLVLGLRPTFQVRKTKEKEGMTLGEMSQVKSLLEMVFGWMNLT